MNASSTLASRLRDVLLQGKWISATNYREQLMATDWETAKVSVDGLNSVAKLSFHVHYYMGGLIKVLEGGPLDIHDKYSFDAPPIQKEGDWIELRDRFFADSEMLCQLVEALPEAVLQQDFADEKYGNVLRNLNAMISHCYYHLGQIVIIRKLVERR